MSVPFLHPPLDFFNQTTSFGSRGLQNFGVKCPMAVVDYKCLIYQPNGTKCLPLLYIDYPHKNYGFHHQEKVRPCGAKKLAILAIFHVFGPETPRYSWISAKFGMEEGPTVPSAVPNFTLIRESCPPRATNLKIACWVILIPVVARPVISQ